MHRIGVSFASEQYANKLVRYNENVNTFTKVHDRLLYVIEPQRILRMRKKKQIKTLYKFLLKTKPYICNNIREVCVAMCQHNMLVLNPKCNKHSVFNTKRVIPNLLNL